MATASFAGKYIIVKNMSEVSPRLLLCSICVMNAFKNLL